MNVLLRPVVRILISLVLFAGFALLLNDVEKFFTVSGELFWFLMASPVFWGLFSVCCFVCSCGGLTGSILKHMRFLVSLKR